MGHRGPTGTRLEIRLKGQGLLPSDQAAGVCGRGRCGGRRFRKGIIQGARPVHWTAIDLIGGRRLDGARGGFVVFSGRETKKKRAESVGRARLAAIFPPRSRHAERSGEFGLKKKERRAGEPVVGGGCSRSFAEWGVAGSQM